MNPNKSKDVEISPEDIAESEAWALADLEYEYYRELKAEDDKKYWKQWH